MAGSYNHVTTRSGNLRDNDSFVQMIENLGDAYEAVEEMYGMIWYLANIDAPPEGLPAMRVEEARENYKEGLKIAKNTPHKRRGE
jgi:hypothetical protein